MTAHEDDLAYESEVNREYVAWLERRAGNAPLLPQHRLGYRAAPGSRRIDPNTMCLVGRVRLDYVDPDLGHPDFYVGPAHRPDNGRMTVFSWVAPVAHSFFGGAVDPHEFSQHVVVRRTMVARRSDIVALHDERARPLDGMAFPADAGTHLIVPEAPPRVRRPRAPIDDYLPEVGTRRQDQPGDDRPIEIVPTEANRPSERRPPTLPAGSPADATTDDEFVRPELRAVEDDVESTVDEMRALNPNMRAPEAVLAAITAPRAERLSSVLATLQPDQYDLVIRPAHPPLVVQGHPGTGKTVIAAHRAAYLVHPDRKARLDRVLLLGPTSAYVNHVEGLVAGLDFAGSVSVGAMDAWMAATAGLTRVPAGGPNAVLLDTDWATGRMVQKAIQRARRTGELPSQPPAARRHVWRLLQANSVAGERLSDDPGLAAWAAGLPQYRAAETARRYLPLLAHLSLALGAKVPLFDHIVVDEAQDLTPIEWSLLCEINTGDSWTLVGDMNQRHTDTSYGNWAALIAAILPDVDTKRFKPELFNRGYRSTAKIIAYANRLLPTAERKVASLQRDGAEPLVMKVRRRSRLGPAAIDLALSMLERHPQGTAGIITPDFSTVLSAMPITDGWEVVSSDPPVREREGSRLTVVTPAMARGLEFDVVVVVEPAEFQENLGRRGQLYTSLTRANRELAVVHDRPLPEALRRRGRPIQDHDDPELQSA